MTKLVLASFLSVLVILFNICSEVESVSIYTSLYRRTRASQLEQMAANSQGEGGLSFFQSAVKKLHNDPGL